MVVIAAGAVVGRVVKVEDHPNADKVRLAHVDLGDGGGPVQIVFGGPPVVQAELLVPVAPPGALIAAQRTKKMRKRRYRGMSSWGMLCSLDELGWTVGAPDEVAILQNLLPGSSLDRVPACQRMSLVVSPSPYGSGSIVSDFDVCRLRQTVNVELAEPWESSRFAPAFEPIN